MSILLFHSPVVLVLLAAVNSTVGNLMLKKSRLVLPSEYGFIDQYLSFWFIGGVCFYVINVIIFSKALDDMPVSIAYPILATSGFVMLLTSSSYLFHETISYTQMTGLALALLGIYLIAK
jgi:multidrug transporter EmrE-like cation transporter